MVNNISLYKLFTGVKKINGHSGVNFSFKQNNSPRLGNVEYNCQSYCAYINISRAFLSRDYKLLQARHAARNCEKAMSSFPVLLADYEPLFFAVST